MLLQVAKFYSFLWLSNIQLCTYIHSIFVCSSIDGHLDCFHNLAVANDAAGRMKKSSESVSCSVLCHSLQTHGLYLPSSSVHGIFLVRTLEGIAIPCSRGSSWPRDQTWVSCTAGDSDTALTDSLRSEPLGKQVSIGVHACMLSCFSCVQLFVTLWTIAHQAPLSLGFSRQEYWSG